MYTRMIVMLLLITAAYFPAQAFALKPIAMNTANDTTTTVSLYGFLRPKKEHAATLRRELLALVAPTRAEAGNLVYNIHEEKDGAIFIYEVWRSQADLDKHMQLPHLKRFMEQVSAWLASDIEAYSGKLITPVKR